MANRPPNYRKAHCCGDCGNYQSIFHLPDKCKLFNIDNAPFYFICDSHTSLKPLFSKEELEYLTRRLWDYEDIIANDIKPKIQNLLEGK